MSNATVVHCKKEKYDVYIGRPSKWGNPYSHKDGTLAKFKCNSREEAVEKYEEHLRNDEDLMRLIKYLDGKTLGCWCKPLPCHGDIIIKVLNELKEEGKK